MFITITDQNTPATLHNPVDNRCGNLKDALHEILYKVKWLNISKERLNNWVEHHGDSEKLIKTLTIPDGYYGFCALKDFLNGFGIGLKLNPANLKITLTFKPEPGPSDKFVFANNLAEMLGFKTQNPLPHEFNVTKNDNTYEGQNPVNLAIHSLLYVHLDELSTDDNLYDGWPSTVVRVIPSGYAAYCEHEIKTFTNLQFKNLVHGHHEKLSLRITGQKGEKVKCDDLHVLLEIIEN